MSADPDDLANWQRLSGRITTSGKLTADDPARLAAIGVRHVINLALDDHPDALPDEAARFAEQGIVYTHIPVPFEAPGEAHYRAFVAALDAAEAPVHVHCIANYRVSAFFYRRHRENGMSKSEARDLLGAIWMPFGNDHPAVAPWRRFLETFEAGLARAASPES